MAKEILSGVQQSTFASFADARTAAYKGKLTFARVTGGTDGQFGADVNGKLTDKAADMAQQGKTYVFMGKKCYGSFPQLPLELINALGLSVGEVNSGTVSSLTEYYQSRDIVNILKEIAQKNAQIESSGKTVVISEKTGDKGVKVTNVEVNNDNVTIVKDANGVLSVASSALPFVTEVKLNDASSAVATIAEKKNNENISYTLGLNGGETNQVIKKAADGTYQWAYESSTEIETGATNGVVVNVTEIKTSGEKTYSIGGDFKISGETNGASDSGLVTTYKLLVKNGDAYVQAGDEIKTVNDVFLKEAKLAEKDNVSGIQFTWYVRDPENPSGVELSETFVPLSDLDTYKGGADIDIADATNTIKVDLSETDGNILKFTGEGDDAKLYASAVTTVTINGEKQNVEDVEFDSLVSAVTTSVNGVANEDVFSGTVSTDGVLDLNLNLDAQTVQFDNTKVIAIDPTLSGVNVQTIIEDIVKKIDDDTDGVLTVNVNGVSAGTYNPSTDTTIELYKLSALTIGNEAFVFDTNKTSGHIDSVSATAITYNYTDDKNSAYTGTNYTVNSALTQIINDLAEITDNSISGINAISAYTNPDDADQTLVQLNLNPSNTQSQAGDIISSDEGAVASVATALTDSTKASNAVKMHQTKDNGLFVYIEICGDDMEDEDTPATYSILYTSAESGATSSALGITASKVD